MSVRALLVPVDAGKPIRRITLHGNEDSQVKDIQRYVGGWMDMERVSVVVDHWDDGTRDEKWVYAAVHDTGKVDDFPPNERLALCFEADLYGDAVLTAAHSEDGSSCDLPAMIEHYLGEEPVVEDDESEEQR